MNTYTLQAFGTSLFSTTYCNNTPWNNENANTGNKDIVERVVRKLDSYDINTNIYTDGSCDAGVSDGVSAVIVTTGTAINPAEIEMILRKGGRGMFTCSYNEEERSSTMIEALKWMQINHKYDDTRSLFVLRQPLFASSHWQHDCRHPIDPGSTKHASW